MFGFRTSILYVYLHVCAKKGIQYVHEARAKKWILTPIYSIYSL